MLEVAGEDIQTANLDHYGLVAAICKDLKIVEKIDARLGTDCRRKVSPGTAALAMVVNGLGFTNRRLYLTHQFFETKPTKHLLGEGIKAKDITDDTLGHALDNIAEYGSTQLFAEVAFEIAVDQDLLSNINHIDTTSLSVNGSYQVNDDPKIMEIVRGHSKDHRPDLKQAVLSLVVNGPSAIPLWMEPLDGNSSDKTSFHKTIKNVREFQKQIDVETPCKWIADSALYAKDKLLKTNHYTWLTRVPETIREAKQLVKKSDEEIEWKDQENDYKTSEFTSFYGGIEQRWLLVFSQQAYIREKRTLTKKLNKEKEKLEKQIWHLNKEMFQCENDAQKILSQFKKKQLLHYVEGKIVPVEKYTKRGKPKRGQKKEIIGYKIEAHLKQNKEAIEKLLNRKGRFILATNDMDKTNYTDELILKEYKEQQSVERGFRFLKDPWFMVDSVFLKTPRRIEALMMIMTLCLLVYNVGQYKLRCKLQEEKESLPNQLGKQVKNPTLRWIFQIMEGVGVIHTNSCQGTREIVTNLTKLRRKIITLFGSTSMGMYGLAHEEHICVQEVSRPLSQTLSL